ncbi:MAG: UDP-N-acetylmuramoyl-tripeptide--D-alanyl-D-alanine ligase [Betaproteobacteria bacterium]|nr:UDP-N-acetylmuramoyl-tripeptide--D-alanyl-D-alanine ligase [Betaproteobacteria bacterium]
MDTATAARIVDGRLVGAPVRFRRVTTDSRALAAGDLFVALQGERFDGHDFVPAAFAHGAVAAMVAAERAPALAGTLIAVPDPLAALGRLAAHWRRQFALPVAVVVGSNGKTTVKEMLARILRAAFGAEGVLATEGNLNNAIGLPLTLLRLTAAHRAAAVELGMNHRGETRELAAIAQPTIVVVNNAQREHQEFMASVVEVAAEHADAVAALQRGGVAVINGDDAHAHVWRAAAAAAGARVVTFGLAPGADVHARWTQGGDGSDVVLATPAGNAHIALAVPGRHMVSNALAAAAAALAAGAPLAAVQAGLAAFRAVPGRLVALRSPAGAVVLDDTYNANPDSMRAAIDVLAAVPGTRWLVMGDMGEVGAAGPAFHREIGAYARERGVARLFALGTLARESAAAFGDGAAHYADADALARDVAGDAHAGVTVLVKGSRFMRMERVVAALAGPAAAGAH